MMVLGEREEESKEDFVLGASGASAADVPFGA